MSVFDGEIDFTSVYAHDFIPKTIKKRRPNKKRPDDDCKAVDMLSNNLKIIDKPMHHHGVLCNRDKEYYKELTKREIEKNKKWQKRIGGDLDPVPVQNMEQDLKRTEYLVSYCPRDMPFMSANVGRRAKAMQTFRLNDDVTIPETTQTSSYRWPSSKNLNSRDNYRPKYDPSTREEVQRILRVRLGDSTYTTEIGLLGDVILKNSPYGQQREEPKYGKWRKPYFYTRWVS